METQQKWAARPPDNAEDLFSRVAAAHGRMDEGTYGRCAGCGGGIPWAQLAMTPYAECCSGCVARRAR
jgi:DnaK suppressor protein